MGSYRNGIKQSGYRNGIKQVGYRNGIKVMGSSASGNLEYVGGAARSNAGTESDIVYSITGLTGGIGTEPIENDIVVAWYSSTASASTVNLATGYTDITGALLASDTHATVARGVYKFMGATPDTSITIPGGTGNTQRGSTLIIHVFRGVSQATPLDVTAVTAAGLNSILANPPAITPLTNGSTILSAGAGAHGTTNVESYSSSDLTSFLSRARGTIFSHLAAAGLQEDWANGTVNPAQFTFSAADDITYSWVAMTIALRPA